MHLIFERGDPDSPVGHALIYFRADDGTVLATYVTVPPVKFDLTSYMPGFLAGAMQNLDLGNTIATPLPPIPEEVPGVEYLRLLAERRQDDLVFAGAAMRDPMHLAGEAAEAAHEYGELYSALPVPEAGEEEPADGKGERSLYSGLSERDQLNELTMLVGRLRDSLRDGPPEAEIQRQMEALADVMPAKYRAGALIAAARTPGERGQKLAALYLERCYKLFNEEYLDLERLDREIDALAD